MSTKHHESAFPILSLNGYFAPLLTYSSIIVMSLEELHQMEEDILQSIWTMSLENDMYERYLSRHDPQSLRSKEQHSKLSSISIKFHRLIEQILRID